MWFSISTWTTPSSINTSFGYEQFFWVQITKLNMNHPFKYNYLIQTWIIPLGTTTSSSRIWSLFRVYEWSNLNSEHSPPWIKMVSIRWPNLNSKHSLFRHTFYSNTLSIRLIFIWLNFFKKDRNRHSFNWTKLPKLYTIRLEKPHMKSKKG
jgi:hypothetical protein